MKRSKIVADCACPSCRITGGDGSGNHLILFEDGGAFCNRCKHTDTWTKVGGEIVLGGKPLESNKKEGTLKVDYSEYALANTEIRGIKPDILKMYGTRIGIDESTGDMCEVCFSYKGGWKIRKFPEKKFWSSGKKKGLFGQGLVKSSTLVIVEGEFDAMACYQMMQSKYQYNPPAVVSLPDGATSLGVLTEEMDFVLSHDKVVLCMDNDEAGMLGRDKIAALLNIPVYIASLPAKDANDCLLNGQQAEFIQAMIDAKRHKPSGIVTVHDLIADAMAAPARGIPSPWKSLDAATYGFREGEGYYIGAGVKCGKSEWLNQLLKHLISLEIKSFIVKGEEIAKKTVRKMGGKMIGKVLSNPDTIYDAEELRDAMVDMDDYLLLYDRNNSLDWDDVKAAIRHAVIVWGAKFVFLDPVTCFTDGMEARDINTFLAKFSRELDQMAKDLGFTYFCFVHLNNPSSGPEHNRGGKVLSSQFTGSRAMVRAGTYILGIERDKDPEIDEEEQNTSYFVMLDDRENGNTCRFPVFYDKITGDYLEPKTEF